MGEPKFSVVIPAFNEQEVISSALESVQGQTRGDWEVLVVDDGSTDATVARVKPFLEERRIKLISERNGGPAAARNAGIEKASGRYVTFLDSDDLMMPGYLESMDAALDANPSAGLAYTDAWVYDGGKGRFRRATAMAENHPPSSPPRDPAETIRLLMRGNFIFVGTTVRRSVLAEVGAFDVTRQNCEDFDLWLRILRRGYPIVRASGILAIRREAEGRRSSHSVGFAESVGIMCRDVADDDSLPNAVRQAAETRVDELERWRRSLVGEHRTGAARLKLRRLVGPAARTVLGPYLWRRRPPREVREALPHLVDRI